MTASTLLRKIHMNCPLCDKIHEVDERERTANTIIKGEHISYKERFYFCADGLEGEHEFETGEILNENLMAARNAYRVIHGLLTSQEIVKIRETYGLTQIELAKLLGWGEATISRYESKAIQDEAYDNMLRIIKDDPLKAIEFLDRHSDKFSASRREKIRSKLIEKLGDYGKEYLTRQSLESEYVLYSEPSDYNGYILLNIDKIEGAISYFARKIQHLYKVKLMKLLWYADSLSYKTYNHAITGLVYSHEPMGALPLGHYNILNLKNVMIQEEEGNDTIKYHILPNPEVKETVLTAEDIYILDMVIEKFKNYNAEGIIKYMHKEKAYIQTGEREIIPFRLAGEIYSF